VAWVPLSEAQAGAEADGTPWIYFDLEKDPLELKNLTEDPVRAGEIAELRKLM